MHIITLTTDYGLKDYYVGALKGAIYNEDSNAVIVDISHLINPFDVHQAAYIINNAYKNFPENTIHIIGVDGECSLENEHLVMRLNNQYFIGVNNGILSILASTIKPESIIKINAFKKGEVDFSAKSIFAKTACHIARGKSLSLIGEPFNKLMEVTKIMPVINEEQTQIIGSIDYIDNYGNIITNISKKLIQKVTKTKEVQVIAGRYVFKKIYNSYTDMIDFNIPKNKRKLFDGEKMALYNSNNMLEIALFKGDLKNGGGASSLLGLKYRDRVTVEFKK